MPVFSKILNYILFADDTTGIFSSPSLDEVFTVINNELDMLHKWFSSNNLQVNASKTNLVLFMTNQKETVTNIDKGKHFLSLDQTPIVPSNSVKFLGLQLDKNLTFKNHIGSVSTKLTKGIFALSRASKVLPTKDLKTIYSAIILPHLNYGLLSWGGACKINSFYRRLDKGPMKNHMRSLACVHKLQKRALRIISKQGFYTHHIPLCASLKLLDLEHLYDIKALSFFHDFFHGRLPPFFANKFTLCYSRRNELMIKYRRTNIAAATIFHTLPDIWNNLPKHLKSSILLSKSSYLLKLKEFYISTYEKWICTATNCFICANK